MNVIRRGEIVASSWGAQRGEYREGGPRADDPGDRGGRRPPLSAWGCDGVLFATPTGSTGYAWSASGPVVWPTVDAMLLVPISAHALFARPMVVSGTTGLALEVLPILRLRCCGVTANG